ncbi:MAG: NACHT domain-containing protein [Anaerolineae bacterium]|nr:NACHT domain-containing protein [Anaerolineae bacterium]
MSNLSPNLHSRLIKTLLRCGAFKSDDTLETIFVDARISQWADDLPEASSKGELVRATIKYLSNKRNTQGENALVLFLHVLRDQTSTADTLRKELADLADELEQVAPAPDTPQWDAALDRYRERIQEIHGTMRVLGKYEPVSFEGIYTDVYLLEEPKASRYVDLTSGETRREQRQDGLSLIQQLDTQTVVILGKPGAGKTTFLKYVAVQAATGKLGDYVPIFIYLREWDGEKLLDILAEEFEGYDLTDTRAYVEHLLQSGEALVLLDGLDEMSTEDQRQLIKALERFSRRYLDCRILITCRVAATSYQFERAKYVEVSDFTDEQMQAFATNWFKDDTERGKSFVQNLWATNIYAI